MTEQSHLRHLTANERSALAALLAWLRAEHDARIVHVWLFGSKARGDFDEESDVDLLIIAKEADPALERAISDVAFDLSLEYSVLLCEHVVSDWRFRQMNARQEPLYRNIAHEGVDLWAPQTTLPRVGEERSSYELGTPEEYLQHRLERSHQDLEWARDALGRGEHRLALNRAYYAVFHLTAAVLATLGVVRHRHSGIESAFHEHLIKPGLIEPEYGRFYREARRWRENADYHLGAEFTKERTQTVVEQAGRTVARLERFLQERGLLAESGEER